MAETDGSVRLSVTFDAKEVNAGVRNIRQSFDALVKSATEAVHGVNMDAVTKSAKEAGDSIKDLQGDMGDMSAAEAKLAAQLARALAQVQSVAAQIATANNKAEESAGKLALRQQTLQDSMAKTTAEADKLQAEWDGIERTLKRDRTSGELLPGQDDKIAQLDKLGSKMADLDDKTRQYKAELDSIGEKLAAMNAQSSGDTQSALKAKLDAAIATADALQKKLDELRAARVNPVNGNSAGRIVPDVSSEARKQSGVVYNAFAGAFGKIGNLAKTVLGGAFAGIKGMAEGAFKNLGRLAKRQFTRVTDALKPVSKSLRRIGQLALSAFLFNGISQAFRKISEGFDKLIAKDKQLKAQMSTVKGNLVAAFAPLWTVVRPALEALLNVIIAITSALANLSRALFGGASGATQLAGAFNSAGGAAKSAGSAAKKAKDQFGSFDEINQLTEKDSGGGGAGGGGGSANGLLTDLTWTVDDLYEKLLAFDWDAFAKRVNNSLLGINWQKIGNAFRKGITYITSALDSLLTGIDWETLGANMAKGANDLVKALPNIAATLANWFNAKIKLFYGFVSTFDFSGFGKSIGQALSNLILKTDWAKLIQGFGKLAIGVMDGIVAAIKTLNTDDVKKALKEILETAVKTLGTITLHLLNIVLDGTGIKLDEGSDVLQIAIGALAAAGIVAAKVGGVGGVAAAAGLAISLGTSLKSVIDSFYIDGNGLHATEGAGDALVKLLGKITGGIIGFALGGVTGALVGTIAADLIISWGQVTFDSDSAARFVPGVPNLGIADIGGGKLPGDYSWSKNSADSLLGLSHAFEAGLISEQKFRDEIVELGGSLAFADKQMDRSRDRMAEWNQTAQSDATYALANRMRDSGISADELAQKFYALKQSLVGGQISASSYAATFVTMGGNISELVNRLSDVGLTVDQIQTALGDNLKTGTITLEEYAAAMAQTGMSLEEARLKGGGLLSQMEALDSKLGDGSINVVDYLTAWADQGGSLEAARQHLINLGVPVDQIDLALETMKNNTAETAENISGMGDAAAETNTPMGELAETTADVETASKGASDATEGLSVNLAEASESGDDLASTTETVADNATDAAKQSKKYGDQMGKTADDTESLEETQNNLNDAVVSVAEATDASAEDMAASLATNLSGWRYYAQQLTTLLQNLTTIQKAFWDNFRAAAQTATSAVQSQVSQLGTNMKNTLTSAWKSVIDAINGSGGGGIGKGISVSFKSAVNQLIRGLNSVLKTSFSQINNVFSKLRNTQVMGKYPFSYLPSIKVPNIPALAKGAVIPANREFLAILGDQKSGTNVEAPLDTITEAMMIALQAQGGTLTPEAIAAAMRSALQGMGVYFDRQQAGRIMAGAINDNRRADGRFAYDL